MLAYVKMSGFVLRHQPQQSTNTMATISLGYKIGRRVGVGAYVSQVLFEGSKTHALTINFRDLSSKRLKTTQEGWSHSNKVGLRSELNVLFFNMKLGSSKSSRDILQYRPYMDGAISSTLSILPWNYSVLALGKSGLAHWHPFPLKPLSQSFNNQCVVQLTNNC
jgi:hypothetical protein